MCQHWREERTQVVFGRERATSIYTETRYSSSSGNRKKNQILKLKPIRSARLSRVCIIATQLNLSNQKKKKHPQYAANPWYCGEQRVSDSPKKITAKKKKKGFQPVKRHVMKQKCKAKSIMRKIPVIAFPEPSTARRVYYLCWYTTGVGVHFCCGV